MGRIVDWSVLDAMDEYIIGEVACYWFAYEPYRPLPGEIASKVRQLTQLLVKENSSQHQWMAGHTAEHNRVSKEYLLEFAKRHKLKTPLLNPKLRDKAVDISELIGENEKLKAENEQLKKEKMPVLDDKHPYRSEKLQVAIQCWDELFSKRTKKLTNKEKGIKEWIAEKHPKISEPRSIMRVVNPATTPKADK